jgi:hypothetical protein
MADRFRRKNRHRSKWNTGFHICGKSQRDRKGNFKKGGKIFRSWQQNKRRFFSGTLSLNGNALNVTKLQCHTRQNWRRMMIDLKDLGDIEWWFDSSKTIPEGFYWIPIVCFKHRRIGKPILTLRSASVGKYKLYLSRQRNIRVDPFGDKELNRCKSHWLQLSRTTEPRQHRTDV